MLFGVSAMSVRFRPNVTSMLAYVPGEQPPAGARLIKLNTNENPYPPSPRVAEAVRAELDEGDAAGERLRLYSDPSATELREAAAELYSLPLSRVMAGNGSDELLSVLTRALAGERDSVAYPYPTYLLYETMSEIQGASLRTVDFPQDFSLPEGLFGGTSPLTFVPNPNAPSGTPYRNEDLARLARSLEGRALVVDEAYGDFADETALDLIREGEHENLVVLRTLSKSYSLAGMRVGLLFASEAIITELAKVKDSYSLDRLAIVAGAAALRDQAWMRENVRRIRATRERLSASLLAMGLSPLPTAANFVFVRMGSAARAKEAFASLRSAGILVRYFEQRLLDDGLRITVGTDDEVDALLKAMRDFTRG